MQYPLYIALRVCDEPVVHDVDDGVELLANALLCAFKRLAHAHLAERLAVDLDLCGGR